MSRQVVDATRRLDAVLRSAAELGASDIHCESLEDGLVIRFRVDGEMQEHARLPVAERDAFVSRGKIFGAMDITERRLPQDGRAVLKTNKSRFNLRLSTLPTVHGESLVIRLLDQTMPGQSFEALGYAPQQATALRAALTGPAGLIYLTGPTGSGKTTTLHSALHEFDCRGRVICTLEDPVEYEFSGIRQTEIREKIGLTFASSLRALLRQNPDVILVGETRDEETADLAVQGALTGHRVLSTLHTNDALAAVARLIALKVKPYLLASTLRLVAAQRLVRRLCPDCKRPHRDAARLRETHGLPNAAFHHAVGCPACQDRGYKGRLAIHEVIPTARFLPLIERNAPLGEFAELREEERVVTLWMHGLAAASAGLTTLEEVARVL